MINLTNEALELTNKLEVCNGQAADNCIVFSLKPFKEPLITIQADGSFLLEGKPCQDGDGIMAAFNKFGKTIEDSWLANIPISAGDESGDEPYRWVVCINANRVKTFWIELDGTFVWRGRPIGKDLRTARAIVGIAQYK